MPSLCLRSPQSPSLPTIISTDILCANAVIDTFITSKEIQFSFQSPTGMNSATSSAANNEGAITGSQRTALPSLHIHGGKVCQTVCRHQRLFDTNGRQLSDRLASNFIVRQMSFFLSVMPAVSPFNALTLVSAALPTMLDPTRAVGWSPEGGGDTQGSRRCMTATINCSAVLPHLHYFLLCLGCPCVFWVNMSRFGGSMVWLSIVGALTGALPQE